MKKFFVVFLVMFCGKAYSQQINAADLIGIWDQEGGKHPATMIFEDGEKIRYSYKGHTGTSRTYYYVLHPGGDPALLSVDYNKKHKRHRNEYLIRFADHNTLKLQVLFKKDSREHFTAEPAYKTVTLIRRKDA